MQFQTFEKKPKPVKKSKKTVNYTTIRKQIPSFERSVESIGSTIKILKYPKQKKEGSNSSKSGSMIKFSTVSHNTSKNLTNKSISMNQARNLKDPKVYKFNKYMKMGSGKAAKVKRPEGVSKFEIDLSKVHNSSSRRKEAGSKKDASTFEEAKSLSSAHSKSPDRPIVSSTTSDKFPMPPGRALKLFMDKGLNEYEQSEVLDYKTIYFIGNTDKKIEGDKTKTPN